MRPAPVKYIFLIIINKQYRIVFNINYSELIYDFIMLACILEIYIFKLNVI